MALFPPPGSVAPPGRPADASARWKVPGVGIALIALVWVVFGQTVRHGFTDYDDPAYVTENPHVAGGLSWQGAAWAFTHSWASNWHPLTWIAHMLDVQLYGLNAGGHHASNVLLHTTAAVLLFLVLREMTGALWRSAFVAAVFSIHPLRVESVAWVAERKDVLSGVFFMLTLGAYVRYVRSSSKAWYAATLGCFTLGLLSKPSLVTLPFVLLLLDGWPLARFGAVNSKRIVLEKIPLLALSAGSCVATVMAQTRAIIPIGYLPLTARLANAVQTYIVYLWQTIFPMDLALFYPLRIPPWWAVTSALSLLVTISAVVLFLRGKQPWLAVGWFWYLGVLVPMIGLIQVGEQAHADRYTYLPQIGIILAVTWTLDAWWGSFRSGRVALGLAAGTVLATTLGCAHRQAAYWRDNRILWKHAIACTSQNATAHRLLGLALTKSGQPRAALEEFEKSARINPYDPETLLHLGVCLMNAGRVNDAIVHLRRSLILKPSQPGAETDLALALARQGRRTESEAHYRRALEFDPDFFEALNDLAWALATDPASAGDGTEAVRLAEKALKVRGKQEAGVLDTLAAAYAKVGRFPEAVSTAESALRTADPGLAASLREKILLYRAGKPFVETNPTALAE